MRHYKIYILFLVMFFFGFVVLSCEKRYKEMVVVSYNYLNEAEVKVGDIYRFPLILNHGGEDIPFVIKESPLESKLIIFDEKQYLEWEPKKTGTYEITISNSDDSFQQTYEIKVTK